MTIGKIHKKPGTQVPDINDHLETIENLAKKGVPVRQICKALGVSDTTYYRERKINPRIQDAWDKGRAQGTATVVGKLWELILEKNLSAIIFWLKTQAGWKEQIDLNLVPKPTIIKRLSGEEVVLGVEGDDHVAIEDNREDNVQ